MRTAPRARAKQGDPAAQRLARLLDRYDRGRGDFRMAFALLMSASAAALLSWAAPAAAEALNLPVWLCSLVLLIVYAVLAMALALIVPGSAGAHAPEGAIRLLAAPGECILRALTPVMLAAYGIGYAILRPLHIRPGGNAERVTEKEIRMMMELGEEEGRDRVRQEGDDRKHLRVQQHGRLGLHGAPAGHHRHRRRCRRR